MDINTQLINAINTGNILKVRAILAAGADVHANEDCIFKNCSTKVVNFIKRYLASKKF
jgi:hypothetical protein